MTQQGHDRRVLEFDFVTENDLQYDFTSYEVRQLAMPLVIIGIAVDHRLPALRRHADGEDERLGVNANRLGWQGFAFNLGFLLSR
jgi:hypothetical protein